MATQPGPWEDFQQPAIPAAPVERRGRPRLPSAQTPAQAEADRLGVQLAEERLARERAERALADARRPGQLRAAEDPAGDASVDQRRNAGFYLRANRSNEMYEQYAVPPRGVIGQAFADAYPNFSNSMTDTQRQQAEATQRDFIAATLRYESGAAIPPSEFETQRRTYFPSPGDAPETIALKAQLRRNAIEALQRSAGQAANGIASDGGMLEQASDVARSMVSPGIETGAAAVAATAPPAAPSGPAMPSWVGPEEPAGDRLTSGPGLRPPNQAEANASAGSEQLGRGDNVVNRERAEAIARQVTDMARAGRTAGEINAWLQANGAGQLDPVGVRNINEYRRRGRSRDIPPFAPNYELAPPQRTAGDVMGIAPSEAAQDFAVGALDSASLGLPGLFSEDYRNRVADSRARSPVASTLGSITGAVVAPGGPRPGMTVPQQMLRTGGQGAFYGFNSSGGDVESALTGGAIGAVLPPAFSAASRAVRPVRNAFSPQVNITPEGQRIALAAREEDIPISRPIVDPSSRDRMAYLEASRGTGNRIREGLQATREGIERRVDRLSEGGTAQEPGTMGDIIQNAGQRSLRNERTRLSSDYTRAAELADGAPIYAREFVSEIDDQIATLNRSPNRNRAVINYLNTIKRDFVDEDGNLIPRSVQDIRTLRTDLNGEISRRNLTQTPAERMMTRALDRARDDIKRDLSDIQTLDPGSAIAQQRQQAWQLYRQTDVRWELQSRFRRQVLDRIIGPADNPKTGAQVLAQVNALAAGESAREGNRLSRMWGAMSRQEQQDTAATIASTFGGAGDDGAFSLPQFLKATARIQPSHRALIFGPEGAESIANLRVLAQALKQTEQRLNNSRSGQVRNWGAALRELRTGGGLGLLTGTLGGGSLLTTGATGLALGAAAAGTGMAFRNLSARALMNPKMTRWLATAPNATTPGAIRQHINRLAVIERSNPAIAQDIIGLRAALMNAVNDNVGQVRQIAASPRDNEENRQ